MEEIGETSTVTTEVSSPPTEAEPERKSEVTEEPEVAKVAEIPEEPEVAKVSEEPDVAKVSLVSEEPPAEVKPERKSEVTAEPDVAKVSVVSEEPVVTKASEVSEEPVAKVSQVSEEPERKSKVSKELAVAKVEEPDVAKASEVSEAPDAAKVSQSQVSEEPERKSKVSEKPERKSKVSKEPAVAKVDEPDVAKASEVSEAPDVAKVSQSQVSEEPERKSKVSEKPERKSKVSKEPAVAKVDEPDVAKASEVSEAPDVAKVSQSQVSEEPERKSKVSKETSLAKVSEEPGVAKVSQSQVSEEPGVPKESQSQVSEEPAVAKVSQSQVSEEPGVAKVSQSQVSEEPDVAKVSLVSEEHDAAKVSFVSGEVSEEHDFAKLSLASEEISEGQEVRFPSEPETINLISSPTETTIQSDENLLNLGDDDEPVLNLAGSDTEVQGPPKGFDDEDEELIKLKEPDEIEHLQLQEIGEGEGEYELLQLQEGEEGEGETKPQEEIKKKKTKKGEEAIAKKGEKQERTSLDLIEGIQPSQYSGTELNLEEIKRSITGGGPTENIFGQIRLELGPPVTMTPEFSTYGEEEEEGTEQSEEFSILAELGLQLKEKEPIDRDAYEDEFRQLKETEKNIRRKNGLLHKKITEYYLRRKITKVFLDVSVEMYEELLDKYEQKMEDLFELRLRTSREREAVDNELLDMIHLRDEQMEELKKNFRDMQDREFEIGHGLINTKTGKIMPDKVIYRLLQRQQQKMEDIAKIRLAYIKRRDRIREIEQKIKSLETIGGTLHLMDFEQLKMENQNFTDKIEERDEELMKLRDRYSHAMLGLAHIREKVNIIEVEISNMCEKKVIETENASKVREELNNLKMQRDYNRAERERLRKQTGILTYPDLLSDMKIRVKTKEILTGVLNDLKGKHEENRIKLINIRKNVIFAEQEQIKEMNALRNIPSGVRGTFKYSVFN